MKKREKVNLDASPMDLIITMSEGNPGACTALMEMIKEDQIKGLVAMLDLDDMNIRGCQIWVGYKNFAGQDINKFMKAIKERSQDMVNVINDECIRQIQEEAVTSGASFKRAG